MNYDLPRGIEIDGVVHNIRSDYRAILDIISVINDLEFSDKDKAIAIMTVFYEDPDLIEDWEKGIKAAFWFISCGQDEPEKKKCPRLVDWDKDFQHIVSAVNKVAGREVRADDYCHWWTFMGYFDALDGESTFASIVNIRNKKAKGTKLEKWEKAWYHENKHIVDIRQTVEYTEQEQELLNALRGGKHGR